MATPNLGMNRPAHGTFPDTWEGPVNFNWDAIDAAFAATGAYDLVPGTGHTHDGTAGQGPKIRHQDLAGAGVLTHTQLDAGSSKVMVSVADTVADYLNLKVIAGVNVVLAVISGPSEQLVISVPSAGGAWTAADEYGGKHAVPTSAPVSYTDNFNFPPQTALRDCGYARTTSSPSFEFYTTGYSAMAYVDPSKGDPLSAQYAATVACHIPHGRAQRVTLSLTDLDYSELTTNDTVEFTLALHSTHLLGAHLPQQIGVVLEIHFTCTGPGVYTCTHRIYVLPNAIDKVLLFECHNHVNPQDLFGCWELAMDSNGHIYHYWRRNLVFSSQTLPNSIPGPVAAYFAALSASLIGLGEPKYGAMGFGCQYAISMFSKFNVECRWLSVTADCDVYDEVPPVCPGILPPVGMPSITPLPREFWFVVPGGLANGIPGAECCAAPLLHVGDVLETDTDGNPATWVTGCNEIPIITAGAVPPTKIQGFTTNKSWEVCFPCVSPAGTPTIFNPPLDWPKEGTTGAVIVHGIGPLPPYMEIISSTPGFVIVDVVWLNWWEFLLKYVILDGFAGTAVTLTIRNKYVPAITFTTLFVTIANSYPIFSSATWLDSYEGLRTLPAEGYEFNVTLNGTGFDVGCAVTSPTIGVTIVSTNRISDSRIDAAIRFDFDMGTSFVLTFTNPDGHTDTETFALLYVTPIVDYKTLAPNTLIGAARTYQIFGNFFSPGVTAVLNPGVPPGTIANFTFVRVSQFLIQGTFDVIGGLGAQVDIDIVDVDRGTITVPLFQVGDIAVPSIGAISLSPTPVYNNGVTPYLLTVNSGGLNFGPNVDVLISGPYAAGEIHQNPGGSYTVSAAPGQAVCSFMAYCTSAGGFVNVQVSKPGVGVSGPFAPFATSLPLAPLVAPVVGWSAGLEPGAAGVMTATFPLNASHLTEISSCTPAYVTFSGRVWTAPNIVTYNYVVSATAVEGTPITVHFRNGPCDLVGVNYVGSAIEYVTPTITSIEIPKDEWYAGVTGYLIGTGFQAGSVVAFGGQTVFVGSVFISPTRLGVTVNHLAAGASTVQVTNPDGKIAGPIGFAVTPEVAPDRNHCELVPAITGSLGAKMYVYGTGLFPPGAAYVFAGFNVTSVDQTINNYLEFTGNIIAPAGNWVSVVISSTAMPGGYPSIDLVRAEASPGGTVIINSVGTPTAKDNQIGIIQIVEGFNLDLIIGVEADVVSPDLQNLDYIPVGIPPAVSFTIISSTPDRLVLSMDIGKGVAPNVYNLLFYGVGPVLLATAPNAFTALPADTAPQITAPERLALDGVIPSGAGLPWAAGVVVSGPTPWMFGDFIEATGFALALPPTYNAFLQTWTVNGINGLAGAQWQLKVKRPAVPDECVYRIVGGVVT